MTALQNKALVDTHLESNSQPNEALSVFKLRLPTPHMTRCMCLWLYDEKILPETGTLLRPRPARLVHRTLATVKITDQTCRLFLVCALKIMMTST